MDENAMCAKIRNILIYNYNIKSSRGSNSAPMSKAHIEKMSVARGKGKTDVWAHRQRDTKYNIDHNSRNWICYTPSIESSRLELYYFGIHSRIYLECYILPQNSYFFLIRLVLCSLQQSIPSLLWFQAGPQEI